MATRPSSRISAGLRDITKPRKEQPLFKARSNDPDERNCTARNRKNQNAEGAVLPLSGFQGLDRMERALRRRLCKQYLGGQCSRPELALSLLRSDEKSPIEESILNQLLTKSG